MCLGSKVDFSLLLYKKKILQFFSEQYTSKILGLLTFFISLINFSWNLNIHYVLMPI